MSHTIDNQVSQMGNGAAYQAIAQGDTATVTTSGSSQTLKQVELTQILSG